VIVEVDVEKSAGKVLLVLVEEVIA